MKYLQSKCGQEIQKLAIKLLVKNIKHTNRPSKKEIMGQVEKEFLIKKGYFFRKVYFEFFIEMTNSFSVKFLETFDLIDKIFIFLEEDFYIFNQTLKLLEFLIPLLPDVTTNKIKESIINIISKKSKDTNTLKVKIFINA